MKFSLLPILLFGFSITLFAQTSADTQDISGKIISNGVGLGAVISVVTSWSRNRSVAWAIVHGILSWFYVIYFVITRREDI